jgi:hypothetical protein
MTDIWIGLADAVPVDPRDDDVGGAFVQVLAPADDVGELRAAAAEALIELGFRLADLSEAEPVRERLQSAWVAPDLVELAIEAALERATKLGDFYTYPLVDGDEPDAEANLQALAASRELVDVRGPREEHSTIGYVSDAGAQWVLIQLVDRCGGADGFRAVRRGTIGEIEPVDADSSFLPRLLDARPLTVRAPAVDLDDTRALLQGAQQLCALVTISSEDMVPGAFQVGRIAPHDDDGVLLRKVSPIGTWIEEEFFRYDAITRVGFGGAYEAALALAVGAVSG